MRNNTLPELTEDKYIVVFDGVCHLCNQGVNFIIKRDHKNLFLFTPMQSEFAQQVLAQSGFTDSVQDTFVLIKHQRCLVRTEAALEITKDLSGGWWMFRVFLVIPRPIRDGAYRLLAKYRYALFGKYQTCMVPTDAVKKKFIIK